MSLHQIPNRNFHLITGFNLIFIFKTEKIELRNLKIFILIEFSALIMREIHKIVHCKNKKNKKILTIPIIIIMHLIHLIIF